MIELFELSTDMSALDFVDGDELLDRLCEATGVNRADLLEPFDPTVYLGPEAQSILDAVDDAELKQCVAQLLYLQAENAKRG